MFKILNDKQLLSSDIVSLEILLQTEQEVIPWLYGALVHLREVQDKT